MMATESFFSNLIYYNLIGLCGYTTTFCLLEYISDPYNFKENMYNTAVSIGMWSFDKVVSIKMLCDETFFPLFVKKNTVYDNNNDDPTFELVYDNNGNIINFQKGEEELLSHLNYFKKIMINNKIYYVSNTNPNKEYNEEIIPETPLFLSISLKFDIEYDIYDELKPYLVFGNKLSITFFKAFMKKYFNVQVANELTFPFTINFIDSSFNISNLNNNETIVIQEQLLIEKNMDVESPSNNVI